MLIGVDVGGTFTDVVKVSPDGVSTAKVPSTQHASEVSVLRAAGEVGTVGARSFNHASTHGVNAIITRALPKVAFLTTVGHRDILDMARNWRPLAGLTDASWRRPFGDAARPLVPRYLRRGIHERVSHEGEVIIPVDLDQAREELAVLRECEVQGVAICLINSYANPAHERELRDLVREDLGDLPVSISSDVSPLAKEFARASTTVVDILMKILYTDYSEGLVRGLRRSSFDGAINYANCAAQLMPRATAMEHPFNMVLAGPAAGTVASAYFGAAIDRPDLLCCDVGGTSCDISLVVGGEPSVETTLQLEHDLVVNALSVDVESIGAGGGSIVSIGLAGDVVVGPDSAGAEPGPACYGKGGTRPTTTDTYAVIGILDPKRFAGGEITLDVDLARDAFHSLESGLPFDARVHHAYRIALNNIAEGVSNLIVKHGIDPRDFSVMAFGAAGPMLLPAVLDQIHAREVIVPPRPGLFSAIGLVSSDQVFSENRSAYTVLEPAAADSINRIYHEMEEVLARRVGESETPLRVVRSMDARLVGQTWETPFITVKPGDGTENPIDGMVRAFHAEYERRTGNRFENIPVQAVTFRVEAVIPAQKIDYPLLEAGGKDAPRPRAIELRYLAEDPIEANEYERSMLHAGDQVAGPAVIREDLSTTFVAARQTATVGDHGELVIRMSKKG